MNNLNLSDEKLSQLLGMAGQKLGQSPESLKNQLQQGDLSGILGKLDPKTANMVSGLMNNPKALEALMQNDQMKAMLGQLGKG